MKALEKQPRKMVTRQRNKLRFKESKKLAYCKSTFFIFVKTKYMIFDTVISRVEKLKMYCILVPENLLIELNDGLEKGRYNQRVIVSVNKTIEWQGGLVAFGNGLGYIALSKDRLNKLNATEGDTISVELQKDYSKYGHEFPEELKEVLHQDNQAKKRFDDLTPGKQRTIIYYILQNKTSEKRIEKSLLFMENLKLCPIGKETMRQLFGLSD